MSFIVYLAILSIPLKVEVNITCFIEIAQPEGDDEESGHLETEVNGELHVFSAVIWLNFLPAQRKTVSNQ